MHPLRRSRGAILQNVSHQDLGPKTHHKRKKSNKSENTGGVTENAGDENEAKRLSAEWRVQFCFRRIGIGNI